VFVCSCHAVTDEVVNHVIDGGASTVEEITARCGAGGCCGGCWPELQRLVDEHPAARLRLRPHAIA
jgi:bacterioferritin-associated ferredoxin